MSALEFHESLEKIHQICGGNCGNLSWYLVILVRTTQSLLRAFRQGKLGCSELSLLLYYLMLFLGG